MPLCCSQCGNHSVAISKKTAGPSGILAVSSRNSTASPTRVRGTGARLTPPRVSGHAFSSAPRSVATFMTAEIVCNCGGTFPMALRVVRSASANVMPVLMASVKAQSSMRRLWAMGLPSSVDTAEALCRGARALDVAAITRAIPDDSTAILEFVAATGERLRVRARVQRQRVEGTVGAAVLDDDLAASERLLELVLHGDLLLALLLRQPRTVKQIGCCADRDRLIRALCGDLEQSLD